MKNIAKDLDKKENSRIPRAWAGWAFLLFFALALGSLPCSFGQAGEDFYVRPYLQIGNMPKADQLELLWVVNGNQNKWRLQVKTRNSAKWQEQQAPLESVISTPHRSILYHAIISGLAPGQPFQYRLLKNGKSAFQAEATARQGVNQPYRVVLFGDMGANTEAQRKVAFRISEYKPNFLVFLGDIVYDFGRYSEYLDKFFPVYNSDNASLQSGAPLLRSTVAAAVLGNHDVALGADPKGVDLAKFPDGLAYFTIWSQPLNGPISDRFSKNVPKLLGAADGIAQYLEAAQHKYPRMANYSFDFGDVHWLVLDANPYMDWTDSTLRTWVAQDLANAHQAKWKFVCFHQPGFSFDASHYKEQRMRLLCDIFEKAGVNIVFSGHAHDYQRSFPLTFKPSGLAKVNPDGTVDGEFRLDKNFNGQGHNVPNGVIYLVSGAGGARLYPSAQAKDPNAHHAFVDKFISDTHSFTVCDISASSIVTSQISEDGQLLDRFTICKANQSQGFSALPRTKKRPNGRLQ